MIKFCLCVSHWGSCFRDSLVSADNEVTGNMAGDIASAGFATAIMLSPLAAITFGENLLESSAISVCSSVRVLCKKNVTYHSLRMLPVNTYVIDIILSHADFLFLTTDLYNRRTTTEITLNPQINSCLLHLPVKENLNC